VDRDVTREIEVHKNEHGLFSPKRSNQLAIEMYNTMRNKKMKPINYLFVSVMYILLSSCASGPPSSVNLYAPSADGQHKARSTAKGQDSRIVSFSFDDVFEAANEAMFRRGLRIESKDENLGRITANGTYNCNGPVMNATLAVYVEQINKKPESRLTVVVDRYGINCWGGGEKSFANKIAQDVQKVLSTY
jgi:hypothetical protein